MSIECQTNKIIKKLTMLVNIEIYIAPEFFSSFSLLVKKTNNAPIIGIKVIADKIGKFIYRI